ncbi:MAG: beta-1,6-N-acetylglucosaminyltransferase [Alphaproteobacteria bacterium]
MFAYLITAHNEPISLYKMVLTMRDPRVIFFVHIDKKTEIAPFEKLFQHMDNVVLIEDRVAVYWGGWSLVQAALNLIESAYRSDHQFTRYTFLSGLCYPIKPNKEIFKIFERNQEFISAHKMPAPELNKPMSRINRFFVEGEYRQAGLRPKLIKIFNIINSLCWKRDYIRGLDGVEPYAGSSWWSLSHDAIEVIRTFLQERRQIVSFFKNTKCPDECFFQTVIINSHLKEKVFDSLTYVDWKDKYEKPCHIGAKHLPFLLKRETSDHITLKDEPICFVRKISSKNNDIRDHIDRVLKQRLA